jgi:hypothetical protein
MEAVQMNAVMAEEAKQLAAVAESNGNRVTPDSINAKIKETTSYRLPDTTITVAVITLENGFTVTGESACADPANFDAELGKKIAVENAYAKIWPLEGYLLKEKMFREGLAKAEGVGIEVDAETRPA